MGTHFHQTMKMMKQQKQEIIKELVQGQQFAAQLQILLQKNQSSPIPTANELVLEILTSFTHAISVLTDADSGDGQAVSQGDQHSSASGGLYEDSGQSRKRRLAGKDNRGTYQRKKNGQSNVVISSTTQDSQAWRKYGQKEILNAKFPRSYFRCSHKYDQGCKATKHVQRLEQESTEMYSITYIGHHTCRNVPKPVSSIPIENETKMNIKQGAGHEMNNEQSMSEVTNDHEMKLWQDLMPLEPEETVSNYGGYGYCGYSGAAGSNSQVSDFDFLVRNIDFESEFRFG
ncbi:Probable WRKY transcription factor 70 [Linum perenne]